MGRKSVEKQRMDDQSRKRKWVTQLFPVLQQRGLRKFSMVEVASELGISKATLYNYFTGREELLDEIVNWKLEELGAFETELSDKSIPHLARFFAAINLVSTELSGVSYLFLGDLKGLYPKVWQRIAAFQTMAVSILESFYKEGIENGVFVNLGASFLAATDELFFAQISDVDFLKKTNMTISQALESWFLMKYNGIFSAKENDRDNLQTMIDTAILNSRKPHN